MIIYLCVIYSKNKIKNEVPKIKKRLQNKGYKVTKKALDEIRDELKFMTGAEKEKCKELADKHIVYMIEYVYFELLDDLKQRKSQHDNSELGVISQFDKKSRTDEKPNVYDFFTEDEVERKRKEQEQEQEQE
jgi:hypothetical protein